MNNNDRLYAMPFSKIYDLYIAKATRKGRINEEVNRVIYWLTGYDKAQLEALISGGISMREFFETAPLINPLANLIKGTICGVKIEEIEDPLMKNIRYLDKLVDELAKGRPLNKILR
jgi:hypothetical protein